MNGKLRNMTSIYILYKNTGVLAFTCLYVPIDK